MIVLITKLNLLHPIHQWIVIVWIHYVGSIVNCSSINVILSVSFSILKPKSLLSICSLLTCFVTLRPTIYRDDPITTIWVIGNELSISEYAFGVIEHRSFLDWLEWLLVPYWNFLYPFNASGTLANLFRYVIPIAFNIIFNSTNPVV